MNISGHNDAEQNQSLKNLLMPTGSELLALLVLSALALLLLNHDVIWQLLTDSSKLQAETASQSLQPQIEAISEFFKQEVFGKATLFVIWACIGCLAYVIIGALQHFFWRVKTEVDESKFVSPKASKTYWYNRLSQYLYFACISFLTLIASAVLLATLLPQFVTWAEQTIRNYTDPSQYLWFGLATLGLMTSLYVLNRLVRATSYSFHMTFAKIES